MRNAFLTVLMLAVSIGSTQVEAGVVINELLAANRAGLRDADGDASDWIEVFNGSEEAIELEGWALSDDPDKPGKWPFPKRNLEAGKHLLVWASDKDSREGELHAPFALKQKGETVVLTDPLGREVDRIDFGPQTEDRSFGRFPDGGEWRILDDPTPGTPNRLAEPLAPPTFQVSGGFHREPVRVRLESTLAGCVIRYTTDCSNPTETSRFFQEPIAIDLTTVLRARTFASDGSASETATRTYFIEPTGSLPSLSLVVAPEDLWDASHGLLARPVERGDDWERPGSLELFEKEGEGFGVPCGVRVHGGISRAFGKNSFRIYFSPGYGPDRLEHPLFSGREVRSFKRLVLSGGSNDSAADTREIHSAVWTLLRDALMNEVFEEIGVPSIGQRPARLYLNGKPWGIYWIKERLDKTFVEDRFGYTDFDLLKHDHTVEAVEGSLDIWNELNRFLMTHPLHLEGPYREVLKRIDLDNFIDNHIVEMWGGNVDWPHNNHFQLRHRTETGKWIWIPWDSDAVLGSPYVVFADFDMHRHVSGRHQMHADWSTLHFRSLLGNKGFRDRFVGRSLTLLETTLDNKAVRARIERLAEEIRPDIAFETDRWGSSPEEWEKNVEQLARFVRLREKAFREQTHAFALRTRDPAHQGSSGWLRILAPMGAGQSPTSALFDLAVRLGE